MFSTHLLSTVSLALYLFLYLPIIVLIVLSFNGASNPYEWGGFSFKWYGQLWNSSDFTHALHNSLIVAAGTTLLSISLGLLFVLYSSKNYLNKLSPIFYSTLAAPEIIIAVALLHFFIFFSIPLSFSTLIIGHTLLGLGYVIPIIRTRFLELDYRLTEASLDLGASPTQTFMRIIIPLLMPAIIAAALLVFTLSFDDFVISFFCAGASTQTLPVYIYSVIRSGNSSLLHALSTISLLTSSFLIVLFTFIQVRRRT